MCVCMYVYRCVRACTSKVVIPRRSGGITINEFQRICTYLLGGDCDSGCTRIHTQETYFHTHNCDGGKNATVTGAHTFYKLSFFGHIFYFTVSSKSVLIWLMIFFSFLKLLFTVRFTIPRAPTAV